MDVLPEGCCMDYQDLLVLILSVFSKASTPLESEVSFRPRRMANVHPVDRIYFQEQIW